MYVPPHFSPRDNESALDLIDQYSFGLLVSSRDDALDISPVPFLRVGDDRLLCHLARGNPQSRIADRQLVSAIFTGPHAYISPSWYEQPGVPTWNYAAVEARGHATTFTDRDRLRTLVERLTEQHEAAEPAPWNMDYEASMLDRIVGIEIQMIDIRAKFKLSQNRVAADRARVIDRLRARGSDNGIAVAALMSAYLDDARN